jgi:ribonuclease P protein component
LAVKFVSADGPAQVAYALGRSTGGAVIRNRIRRRLRHAVAAERAELLPGAYLFSAGADVVSMPFVELQRRVHELLVALGTPQ